MRVDCPNCSHSIAQVKNPDGPNFCPECLNLFYVPEPPKTPPWILGVLVILTANWQIMMFNS